MRNATVVQKEARPLPKGNGGSIPASSLYFHVGQIDDVMELVMKHHYSRRWPANVQFVGSLHLAGGLFGTCGQCVAGVCFSIPPTRWSEPVLELSRLVRANSKVPLSLLVGLAAKKLKRTEWDLLVSFADATQGHKGGVYRACSWNYDGMREPRMDGVVINGEFVPGRSANSAFGTQSPSRLKERHGIEAVPHYDAGKHLFWKALNQAGQARANRLGLKCSA